MLKTRPKNRALALLLVVLMIFSQTAMTASAEDCNARNVITAFDALAADVAAQTVSAGTEENALTLPETLDATVDSEAGAVSGVTWTSAPAYDGNTPGTYTFTAEIPDAYTVTDGVSVPAIIVTVEPAAADTGNTDPTAGDGENIGNNPEDDTQTKAYENSISGFMWVDTDEDGIRDEGESDLTGFTVSLYAESDRSNAVNTATTGADGSYTFDEIVPGDYVLGIQAQTIGDTEYLLPLVGYTANNSFKLSDDWVNAYTESIIIGSDTVVAGMDAGLRTPPGKQAMSTHPVNSQITLENAISSAASGDIIEITESFDITSQITIPAGKSITIQSASGGAYTLYKKCAYSMFEINGSLILKDIVLEGSTGYVGICILISGGQFTMDTGAVIQNFTAQGVYIGSDGGTFTMNDGKISGSTNGSEIFGAGVHLRSGGTFTMNGGEISGNTSLTLSGSGHGGSESGYGGGVGVVGGTFTMNGGKISGNSADCGGGVAVSNGTFTMNGGEINGNTSNYINSGGGGINVINSTFTMNGGKISGNSSAGGGGGISSAVSGKVNIIGTGCEITNNTAAVNGGGIDMGRRYADITTAGSTVFSGNTAGTGYTPPTNAPAFTNIGFASCSGGYSHPLNNYDISYNGSQYYTVDYNLNGGSGTAPTEIPKAENGTFNAAPSAGLTPPGGNQHFKEWNTDASGSGTGYVAGAQVTMPAGNLTLYAIWEDTCKITVKNNSFTSFLSGITFGLFFKDTADVTITVNDPENSIATIKYIKADAEMTQTELASVTWTDYLNSFSINAKEKFIIYAKITDNAGNSAIISSDGVVVYTDSEATVSGGSFSKDSDDDLAVTVAMNGNTVKSITNGGYTLNDGTDYTTGVDTITFKNAYLKNLADGTYNFTVNWYPLGETGTPQANSDTPGTTTITIIVSKADQSMTIAGLGNSYTYGDSAFALSTSGSSGTGAVTFTSSDPSVASVSGNTVIIHKAGSFTITAKKAADAEYNEVSVTSHVVTVNEATPTVTLTGNNVSYGNNVTLNVTVSGVGAVPTGTVTFKEGATVLAADVTLVNGTASCTVTSPAAGNHNYTAEYAGQTDYYTTATGTASVGVDMTDQAALSITGKPSTVTYGGSSFNLATSGGSGTGAVTFSLPNNDVVSVTSGGVVTINNAGTVTVTATKAGDNNYNAATATLDITVLPRDINNITVTVTGSTVYTGSQLQPAFTVADGTLAIDTGDYTNTYGANVTVAEGGTITLTGQRNYTGTKTVNFTILKATPQAVIFPTADAVTYDPGQTLADVTLSGGSGDGTFTWQDDAIVPTANNSGYTVVFTPGDTDNYDYSGVTLTEKVLLTVNKAEQTLTGLQDLVKTNGGANFTVTPGSNAAAENPIITFQSSGTSVIEVDASEDFLIKGDGTAIITVSAAETDNYLAAEATFKITVLADTAGLDDVINAADDLIDGLDAEDIGNGNGQYPQDAVDKLQDAIDAAKDVANDSSATQAAVDQAKEDLLKAIEDFQNSLVAVDFAALDKAITDAGALEKGYYTDATWSAMQTALKEGKAVRSTAHVTQAEVDAAAKALNAAIAALTNEYKFTTAFGTFTGSGDLTGKIDAPYAKFVRLLIDGKEVDSKNYTVTEGSTVITLKEAYLKTLSNGNYTVTAEFTDGAATTTLNVNVNSSTTSGGSAKTGDDSTLWLWLALIGVSLGMLTFLGYKRRKVSVRKEK